MINYHNIIGSKETSFHDFDISVTGLSITLSPGSYIRGNITLIESLDEAVIDIETLNVDTHYELWLTDEGLVVLSKAEGQEFGDLINPIDRLAWFTVTATTADLEVVEIHYIRMVI